MPCRLNVQRVVLRYGRLIYHKSNKGVISLPVACIVVLWNRRIRERTTPNCDAGASSQRWRMQTGITARCATRGGRLYRSFTAVTTSAARQDGIAANLGDGGLYRRLDFAPDFAGDALIATHAIDGRALCVTFTRPTFGWDRRSRLQGMTNVAYFRG